MVASKMSFIALAAASAGLASATSCLVTDFSGIAAAVASCNEIILQNIAAPANQSIDLSNLLEGTTVTFEGITTFGFSPDHDYVPIILGGSYVTIIGGGGHIIDGNGQAYWDGLGSNGGVPKPNHMVNVENFNNSVITGLYILNYPVHCFSLDGNDNVTLTNIVLNNTAGNAPNAASGSLAAGHNSDGFGIAGSTNVVLKNSWVYNQDDCVAVTSGDSITVSNLYCDGGHGLSIGSIGGKSGSTNSVSNVLFENSFVLNSANGARIKTNYNTTGYVGNITYSNIYVSEISDYGLDIQQDYLNGGPTGDPSNGVVIENILFKNVYGTVESDAIDYYILCGAGSCSNISFENVGITGGSGNSSCNYPASGCP